MTAGNEMLAEKQLDLAKTKQDLKEKSNLAAILQNDNIARTTENREQKAKIKLLRKKQFQFKYISSDKKKHFYYTGITKEFS